MRGGAESPIIAQADIVRGHAWIVKEDDRPKVTFDLVGLRWCNMCYAWSAAKDNSSGCRIGIGLFRDVLFGLGTGGRYQPSDRAGPVLQY